MTRASAGVSPIRGMRPATVLSPHNNRAHRRPLRPTRSDLIHPPGASTDLLPARYNCPMAASLDPRTPVIIGVGQVCQRVDRGEPALEPVDLIAEAARRAADDSG